MEIRKQLSMGRANLPTLQPPGPVDGLEMFGLLSPVIVQAIEVQECRIEIGSAQSIGGPGPVLLLETVAVGICCHLRVRRTLRS